MDIYGTATITGTAMDITYTGEFTATGLSGNADQIVSGTQYSNTADVRDTLKDGEVVGYRVARKRRTLTINFFPTGASTKEHAKLAMELPLIPSKVVISAATALTPSSGTDGSGYNGDWIYLGGGSRSSSEDVITMTLPLVQEQSSTKTATQLTTVIS